jgi:hypothetical protein
MGEESKAVAAATALQDRSRTAPIVDIFQFCPRSGSSPHKNTYGGAGENALLTLAGFLHCRGCLFHILSTVLETTRRLLI